MMRYKLFSLGGSLGVIILFSAALCQNNRQSTPEDNAVLADAELSSASLAKSSSPARTTRAATTAPATRGTSPVRDVQGAPARQAVAGPPLGVMAFGWGTNFLDTQAFGLDYVNGMTAYFGWNDLEPQEGRFDWSAVDQLLGRARASGKKLNIGVYPGSHSPAWVAAAGAPTFSWQRELKEDQAVVRGNQQAQTTPLPWDPIYIAKWNAFVTALAARYASDPSVGYLALTGPTIRDVSTDIALKNEGDWNRFVAAGYTQDRLVRAWAQVIDHYEQVAPNAELVLAVGPLRPGGSDTRLSEAVARYIDSRGYRNIGFLSVFLNDTWFQTSPASRNIRGLLLNEKRNGHIIAYQMAQSAERNRNWRGRKPIVADLGSALQIGINDGASWIEVWHDDIITPQARGQLTPNPLYVAALRRAAQEMQR